MELTRMLRVLRDRWYIVVGLGLLGFFAGYLFTNLANENREPQIRATAAIEFEAQEGDTAESLETARETAVDRARTAAAELISEDESAVIEIDPLTGRLAFRSIGTSEPEAMDEGRGPSCGLSAVDPEAGQDVNELIAKVVERAEAVQAEIDAIQGSLTAEEQALVAQHAVLDAQIAATQERLVEATGGRGGSPPGRRLAAATLVRQLEDELADLEADKAELPPSPVTELSVADQIGTRLPSERPHPSRRRSSAAHPRPLGDHRVRVS